MTTPDQKKMQESLNARINEICTAAMTEEIAQLFVLWEIERQIIYGEIPMPPFRPIRIPFEYRERD